jgi:hypothetical protein
VTGIRIIATDPALRGATYVVRHPSRAKDYHLRLDGEGAVLVSEVIWQRVREIMAVYPDAPRFIEVGQTVRPPTQVASFAGPGEVRPVLRFEHGRLTPQGERTMARVDLKG